MLNACHTKGAANELRVAEWFVRQGHQTYWPTIQQGGIDMIVDIHGQLYRVQVKSASWVKSADHYYLQCKMPIARSREKLHDLLVIVHEEELWVIPSSQIDSSNLSLRHDRKRGVANRWSTYRGTFEDSWEKFEKGFTSCTVMVIGGDDDPRT